MADKNKEKARRLERRKHHVRNSLFGTPQRPRMSVYRSSKHIYVQLIDDYAGKTLAAVATTEKNARTGGFRRDGTTRESRSELFRY